MDMEQLRLITEAVEGLGGEAKIVLIWWIAASTIPYIFGWIGGLGLAWIFSRLLYRLINHGIKTGHAAWLMATELGMRPESNCWNPKHTTKVVEEIRRLRGKT